MASMSASTVHEPTWRQLPATDDRAPRLYRCPDCGAAVDRDGITKHSEWHGGER